MHNPHRLQGSSHGYIQRTYESTQFSLPRVLAKYRQQVKHQTGGTKRLSNNHKSTGRQLKNRTVSRWMASHCWQTASKSLARAFTAIHAPAQHSQAGGQQQCTSSAQVHRRTGKGKAASHKHIKNNNKKHLLHIRPRQHHPGTVPNTKRGHHG